MSPPAVELLRLLALLVLVGNTVWVLVHRDQPGSVALVAGLVGIWAVVAAPHLRHLPDRLYTVSVQSWTLTAVAAGVAAGVLVVLGVRAVRHPVRGGRGDGPQ